MSLLTGLILHTLDHSNHVSQHCMLMRFYELDKEVKKRLELPNSFHDLDLYFMQIEAFTILKTLNIK